MQERRKEVCLFLEPMCFPERDKGHVIEGCEDSRHSGDGARLRHERHLCFRHRHHQEDLYGTDSIMVGTSHPEKGRENSNIWRGPVFRGHLRELSPAKDRSGAPSRG